MVSRNHPIAASWMLVACVSLGACDRTPPRAEPPPPKVMVQQPEQRKLVDYDEYHGWLDSVASVDVRSRVRGNIQEIGFTDGQLVKEGQMLFQIDPRPFQADVDRAKNQLRIYKAQLDKAVLDEKRILELYGKGGATDKERDSALATTESLRAQVDAQGQEIRLKGLDVEYSRVTAPIAGTTGGMSRGVSTRSNASRSRSNVSSVEPSSTTTTSKSG